MKKITQLHFEINNILANDEGTKLVFETIKLQAQIVALSGFVFGFLAWLSFDRWFLLENSTDWSLMLFAVSALFTALFYVCKIRWKVDDWIDNTDRAVGSYKNLVRCHDHQLTLIKLIGEVTDLPEQNITAMLVEMGATLAIKAKTSDKEVKELIEEVKDMIQSNENYNQVCDLIYDGYQRGLKMK